MNSNDSLLILSTYAALISLPIIIAVVVIVVSQRRPADLSDGHIIPTQTGWIWLLPNGDLTTEFSWGRTLRITLLKAAGLVSCWI